MERQTKWLILRRISKWKTLSERKQRIYIQKEPNEINKSPQNDVDYRQYEN